jgi:SAM-dependent methyltransferase
MSDGLVFREAPGGRLEFVGNFDGLYARDLDPWGQSGTAGDMASYYRYSRQRLCEAVQRHAYGYGERLEVGCGLGHVLPLLAEADPEGEWLGLDISQQAIQRARWQHPEYRFMAGDIAGDLPARVGVSRFEVVILNQVLWYILERMDRAVRNCRRILKPGGVLIVSQAFLKGRQRYGAEIAEGFHGALRLFLERYPDLRLIEASYDDSDEFCHNDGLLVFRSLP